MQHQPNCFYLPGKDLGVGFFHISISIVRMSDQSTYLDGVCGRHVYSAIFHIYVVISENHSKIKLNSCEILACLPNIFLYSVDRSP